MDEKTEELEQLLESFHEEVTMTTQVSLTMSKNNRDILAKIRDEINATASKPILETNDIIRLALLAAVRYEELITDPDYSTSSETEEIAQLLAPLAQEVRNDPNFDIEV